MWHHASHHDTQVVIPGKFWSSFPVLRYCLLFVSGILIYEYFPIAGKVFWLLPLLLLLLLLSKLLPEGLTRVPSTFIMMSVLFTLGYSLSQFQDPAKDRGHILNQDETESDYYGGIIIEGPQETSKTQRYLIRLTKQIGETESRDVEGKVILYVRKDSVSAPFEYGDAILIQGRLSRIRAAQKAWEFDYGDYMGNKGVFHQIFTESRNIRVAEKGLGSAVKAISIDIREYCRQVLRNAIKNASVLGVSEALLLGVRQDLDKEIKNAFVDAGAIHVLAVSGLHVGIIYQILLWTLGFLKKVRYGNVLLYGFTVIALFLYALVTGFSPSVTRAVLMFSIVATGNLISRKSNIYNTLALAAFIILITDTRLLFDVGFQLSFAAVFGIVYFYPILTNGIGINTIILDKLYKLSCVSIGAQITTLPITLYYFHQFPNLFLLSNFVVIPLAGIILGSGMMLLAFGTVPFLSDLLAWIHSTLIMVMNKGVIWINSIPYSVSKYIYFDNIYLVLISSLLLVLILCIEYRKKDYAYAMLMLLLLTSGYQWMVKYRQSGQASVLVFNHDNKLHFAYNNGQKISLSQNIAGLSENYSLAGYLSYSPSVFTEEGISWNQKENTHFDYRIWNGITFLRPKSSYNQVPASPDWLIIDAENSDWRPDTLFYPSEGFILGRNIPFFRRKEIISGFEERGFVFHDLNELESIEIPCDGSDGEN